jgi:serine/threonine protein kinase
MVYKGILSDQRVVAIKKSLVIEYSEIKQFINEVAILSEINHRNIVKLFGCCLESEVPLLVYDYISNGSLTQVLHDESRNDVSLSWDDYIRIATEAARALSYLHSAASISVFHRDVKSSNILLDGNYKAKVSDFGASRLVPVDQTHIVTNVQGTFGYLDPEYFYTRQLNEKSDVYSFGVVLLELLVRKKPIFTSNSGLVQSLSNYFLEALKEREIIDIVDPQVAQEATKEEISSVASLAEMCLRLRGEERPTMKQVEIELQILRKKQVSTCQSSSENEQQNETILLTQRAKATCQAFATEPGEGANLPLKHNQRCYSLEEEFMESATLPR